GGRGEGRSEAVAALAEATRSIGGALQRDQENAMAVAVPYLRLFGLAAGGGYLARGALAAARDGAGLGHAQAAPPIAMARFFAETRATAAPGLEDNVLDGAAATLMLTPNALSA